MSTRYETIAEIIEEVKPSGRAMQVWLQQRGVLVNSECAVEEAKKHLAGFGDRLRIEQLVEKHKNLPMKQQQQARVKKGSFDDWFVIENYQGTGQPEGSSEDWACLLWAMQKREGYHVERLAVAFDAEGNAHFWSPRNSMDAHAAFVAASDIDAWVAQVEKAIRAARYGRVAECVNHLVRASHSDMKEAGWWDGVPCPNVPMGDVAMKLLLIHTEISEGCEGLRKGLADDKLPHRTMLEVELADAVLRISDLAGALGLDLGSALAEKMAYNRDRADHKRDARALDGGKKF